MLKICPKCDRVVSYNSHFQSFFCPTCGEKVGGEIEYSVKYYNENIFPEYNSAYCFIRNLDHAISKCERPDDTRKQLECIGMNSKTKEFILNAIEYYRQSFINELK